MLYEVITQRWDEIQAKMTEGGGVACLREAPDPFAEWLAEFGADLASVSVAAGVLTHAARGVLVERVPLLASLGDPFAEAGGEDALADALAPVVSLPSGGRLILEATRAFLAVDVDTGGDTAPDAARRVNDAAMDALARVLVLRNIGGGVVIDAVPESRKGATEAQRRRLADRLRDAAQADPRLRVAGWTRNNFV